MFSHGCTQMVRMRRINNGFIGLNGFLGASSRGCTCLRSALPLARARSAPTEYMNAVCFVGAAETTAPPEECRLFCWCSWDSCTPWRMPFAWLVQRRPLHPLMFVPNLSLEWVLRVLWEKTLPLWKFLKKTLEPSAKPHANIVQVSAAKKFILEKWEACFEV